MKRFAIVVAVVLSLAVLGTAYAQSPGGSKAFGKTLSEWMKLDNLWRIGGEQDNPEGKMVFLPDITSPLANDGEWVNDADQNLWTYVAEIDVTLEPGQKFSIPLLYFFGEVYEDETEDDPDDFDLEALLTQFDVKVWLDDELIMDNTDEDIDDYFYGPVYFDEPVEYDEPVYREEVDKYATAIIWAAGHGFVHPPLSKGEHTLVWYLYYPDEDSGFGYNLANELILNIVVEKKAKKK